MFDLYMVALPIYAVFQIISIVQLKLAMQEIERQERMAQRTSKKQLLGDNMIRHYQKKQYSTRLCDTFVYLIKNFTILQMCTAKSSKRTIVLLFSYNLASITIYFIPLWYISLAIAPAISVCILLIQSIALKDHSEDLSQQKEQQRKNNLKWTTQIMYSLCGIITIAGYLLMCGQMYKNYKNSHIQELLIKFSIVLAADNFAIKPVFFYCLSMAICNFQKVLILVTAFNCKEIKASTKIANLFNGSQQNCKQINLQIEPEPKHIYQLQSIIMKENLPNRKRLSAISRIDNNSDFTDGSYENIVSRNDKIKPSINNISQMQQIQQQKDSKENLTQLNRQYCLNLRKTRNEGQLKIIENKVERIIKNKHKNDELRNSMSYYFERTNSKQSEKDYNIYNICQMFNENQSQKSYHPNKGSVRRNITKMFVEYKSEQENSYTNQRNIDQGNNQKDTHRDKRGPHNKTSILKINQNHVEGDLQQIMKLQSPVKKNRTVLQPSIINQQDERACKPIKNNRRRSSVRARASQPYILSDRLINIYLPGKDKTEIQTYLKKHCAQTSNWFDRSNRKGRRKHRNQPVVHQNDQNQPQFYIPKF